MRGDRREFSHRGVFTVFGWFGDGFVRPIRVILAVRAFDYTRAFRDASDFGRGHAFRCC